MSSAASCRNSAMILVVVFLLLSGFGCGSKSTQPDIRRAQESFREGRLGEAEELAKATLKTSGDWNQSQILLGEIAMARKDQAGALGFLQLVPHDHSGESHLAAQLSAEIYLNQCKLSAAVSQYEYVAARDAGNADLLSMLASLLVISGQRDQANEHLMQMLRLGRIQLKDLVLLTQPEREPPETKYLLKCSNSGQIDPGTLFALSSVDLIGQNPDKAKERLWRAVQSAPGFEEAQARLGELLLDGTASELRLWHAQLPDNVRDHAGVWYVLGMWNQSSGRTEPAIRCFLEAIARDPLHRKAMFQLGSAMVLFEPQAANMFLKRASALQEFSQLIERVMNARGKDSQGFIRMIVLLVEMGRVQEARAWLKLNGNIHRDLKLSPEMQRLLVADSAADSPRFNQSQDLAAEFDFARFPLPKRIEPASRETGSTANVENEASPITFIENAAEAGLNFAYFQSPSARSGSVRVFESTGGGVAVIDYDMDGDCDLCFTQGEQWHKGNSRPSPSDEYHDALFRNTNNTFANVSFESGLAPDDGYGQGCAAGDFDNDGFPDLYIANIGRNRLLHNNGDGTWSDMPRESLLDSEVWTTSCAVLDLNSDGVPDLFDVNYLRGENVFQTDCGESRCSVRSFEGEPDHVHLGRGDGTFSTLTDSTPVENCKGLGLAVLTDSDEAGPCLFIANDQVPNAFLLPSKTGKYQNQAFERGLAVNYLGQPTACMGVAAGDVDQNGFTDLFVTNFEGEANCLYLQIEPGHFVDSIQGTGLLKPGVPYVGWGTQFIDADNDSDLDIVVSNGHVADFGEIGVTYKMPLQLFQNCGDLHFQIPDDLKSQSPFQSTQLGRSLAICDWNSDGKQDFITTCIGTQVLLSTNRTQSNESWVAVNLHATRSARDAAGTRIRLQSGSKVFWSQMPTVTGFQCSCEPIVHFGLGDLDSVDSMEVHWQSGPIERILDPPVNQRIHIIEGRPGFTAEKW